jgi:hypothetical protein
MGTPRRLRTCFLTLLGGARRLDAMAPGPRVHTPGVIHYMTVRYLAAAKFLAASGLRGRPLDPAGGEA